MTSLTEEQVLEYATNIIAGNVSEISTDVSQEDKDKVINLMKDLEARDSNKESNNEKSTTEEETTPEN